jgi:hypothetical protein
MFAYRDKKVVGVFVRFHCAASMQIAVVVHENINVPSKDLMPALLAREKRVCQQSHDILQYFHVRRITITS